MSRTYRHLSLDHAFAWRYSLEPGFKRLLSPLCTELNLDGGAVVSDSRTEDRQACLQMQLQRIRESQAWLDARLVAASGEPRNVQVPSTSLILNVMIAAGFLVIAVTLF